MLKRLMAGLTCSNIQNFDLIVSFLIPTESSIYTEKKRIH